MFIPLFPTPDDELTKQANDPANNARSRMTRFCSNMTLAVGEVVAIVGDLLD